MAIRSSATAVGTTVIRSSPQPFGSLAGKLQGLSPDLLAYRIQTEIRGEFTQHTYTEPRPMVPGRPVLKQEVWRRETILGQGSYGTVFLERCEGDRKKLRALKEVKKYVVADGQLDYRRELEAIFRFSHPKYSHCFVHSYGWFENNQSVFIAMEYLKLGDLQRYLDQPLPEIETREITSQILKGLEYMHQSGFIHRDLKPGNLLVVTRIPRWHVKIADFGISKRQPNDDELHTFERGTFGFAAPEQLGLGETAGSYTFSVDMWSLGAVAYRMLAGVNAFQGLSELVKYVNGKSQFPADKLQGQHMSVNGLDFILRLMSPVPESRLSAIDSGRHPWLTRPIPKNYTPEDRPEPSGINTDTESVASAAWSDVVPSRLAKSEVASMARNDALKPLPPIKFVFGRPTNVLAQKATAPKNGPSLTEPFAVCFTCRYNRHLNQTVTLRACHHAICKHCIQAKLRHTVVDPNRLPPRCCTNDPIPLQHIARVLGLESQQEYKELQVKMEDEKSRLSRRFERTNPESTMTVRRSQSIAQLSAERPPSVRKSASKQQFRERLASVEPLGPSRPRPVRSQFPARSVLNQPNPLPPVIGNTASGNNDTSPPAYRPPPPSQRPNPLPPVIENATSSNDNSSLTYCPHPPGKRPRATGVLVPEGVKPPSLLLLAAEQARHSAELAKRSSTQTLRGSGAFNSSKPQARQVA